MKKYITDIIFIELIPEHLINHSYGIIFCNGNIFILYFPQETIINNKFINFNMNYKI